MKPKEIKYRVLLVDDEKSTLNALKWDLGSHYEISFATNGQEALDVVNSSHIDIVLLDISMPIMYGISALEKIKAIDSNIDVVMVSAKKDVQTVVRALKLGATDYIDKPIDTKKLHETLRV